MKQFKELFEELTRSEERKADSMLDSGHYSWRQHFIDQHPEAKKAFGEYRGDEKRFSTRIPVSITESSGTPNSSVLDFLESKNIKTSHEDYRNGHAFEEKTVGDPERGIPMSTKRIKTKIGALLEKHGAPDDIKKAFVNDTFRTGAKNIDYDLVISSHPHDVFGMSTGRSWASCASMRDGETKWRGGQGPAAKCMRGELNNHTHVVYLLPRGGDVDKDAIARINYKHHTGLMTGAETLISDGHVYGNDAPNKFSDIAEEHVRKLFPLVQGEVYMKNPAVYDDNSKPATFTWTITAPTLDTAWTKFSKSLKDKRHLLYEHVIPGEQYKSTNLRQLSKHLQGLQSSSDFIDYTNKLKDMSDFISDQDNDEYGAERTVAHYNKHFIDANDRAAKQLFDISNEQHREAFHKLNSGSEIERVLQPTIDENLPEVKTPTDYEHRLRFESDIGLHKAIPIASNHSLGRYPLDTLTNHLASKDALNYRNFYKAFMSARATNHRKETVWDAAVRYEAAKVPGMSKVVNNLANDGSFLVNKWSRAKMFEKMKPATRQRIADILGVDHKAEIKEYKNRHPKGWDKDLETTQKYANSLLNSPEHWNNLKSSFVENWNNHNSLKELINEFF